MGVLEKFTGSAFENIEWQYQEFIAVTLFFFFNLCISGADSQAAGDVPSAVCMDDDGRV